MEDLRGPLAIVAPMSEENRRRRNRIQSMRETARANRVHGLINLIMSVSNREMEDLPGPLAIVAPMSEENRRRRNRIQSMREAARANRVHGLINLIMSVSNREVEDLPGPLAIVAPMSEEEMMHRRDLARENRLAQFKMRFRALNYNESIAR
ncbi:unnamed protein product [Trichobilharzia szidati]|nr:unnamed protein product [Trichobilharzia szidati]